jgi:hypothetical protein
MTLDTRARRAAQGIRSAVEVMEMSTSTKEPRKVERFDRFRDRKQRNRRVGALLVAALLVLATVLAASLALKHRDATVPAIPPQNGRIVFGERGRQAPPDVYTVYTINPDGTDVRALSVSGPVMEPDGSLRTLTGSTPVKSNCTLWTDDSSKIYIDRQSIEGRSAGNGLATINLDGTGYTELTPQGIGCGALSPDGTRFLVVQLSNLRTQYASYSPDGTQVVFTPSHDRGYSISGRASGLWVVNADGTGLHLVAHRYAVRPSWSPDGRWILFECACDAAVYIVHADGSGLRRITLESPGLRSAFDPSWSPDGTRILFVAVSSGEENLFTARRDGTDVEQITHTHDISYTSPDWGTNAG